jgi:RHS repeat-associated protein
LRDRDTDGNGTLDERLYATMDYFNGTAVLNTSGVVQERYAYSAFGLSRVMAADFSPRSSSNFAWDFGFQGQFRDRDTGWYNYGYRFYAPELGRWINRDPIEEVGGMSLYGFVKNNGLNLVDILGLDFWPYENCEWIGWKAKSTQEVRPTKWKIPIFTNGRQTFYVNPQRRTYPRVECQYRCYCASKRERCHNIPCTIPGCFDRKEHGNEEVLIVNEAAPGLGADCSLAGILAQARGRCPNPATTD